MKVIEVAHPIQEKQYIQEDVAMAFGFFDGMHKGHAKVFDTRINHCNLIRYFYIKLSLIKFLTIQNLLLHSSFSNNNLL